MARVKCPKCFSMNAAKAALQKCPKCPQKAAMKCSRSSPAKAAKAAMKCKAAKAMKVGRPRKCSKVKKAMKVAECSKVKKAMKAMKEWKVAMKAAKVAMKAECSKLKKAMKAVECLKATKAKMDEMIPLDLEKLAKAANEGQELGMWVDLWLDEIRTLGATLASASKEQVETRGATITDSKEQVETLGATITDAEGGITSAENWEVLVLGYFWKNGRPKFKYIVIEREP